jgi:Leucine-rich repeat (LRR) protein
VGYFVFIFFCYHNAAVSFTFILSLPTDALLHVTLLDISRNQVHGPLSEDLPRHLPALEIFKLAGNRITALPNTINQWRKLRTLICGSECQGGNLIEELPDTIGDMPALEELDMSHNQLRRLPDTIGNLGASLRILTIYGNQLESLDHSVCRLHSLRSLNVAKNRLEVLPDALAEIGARLEMVDLSNNHLQMLSVELADYLRQRTVLLAGNPFDLKRAETKLTTNLSGMVGSASTSTSPSSQAKQIRNVGRTQSMPLIAYRRSSIHDGPLPSTNSQSRIRAHVGNRESNDLDMRDDLSLTSVSPPLIKLADACTSTDPALTFPDALPVDVSYSPVPSLLELSARTIIANQLHTTCSLNDPQCRRLHGLPGRLVRLLCLRGGQCFQCQGPYLREYHCHVAAKDYLGHCEVPQQMRLCSQGCLKKCRSSTSLTSAFSSMSLVGDIEDSPREQRAVDMMQPAASATTSAETAVVPSTTSAIILTHMPERYRKKQSKLWKWMDRVSHFQQRLDADVRRDLSDW